MSDRDPLDLLQEAWQSLPAEESTPSLKDSDSTTQQSVAWMRDAWQQMEIPVAALAKRRRILSWRSWSLSAVAAAAAALLISALIFLNSQDSISKDLEPNHVTVNGVGPTLPTAPDSPPDPPLEPPTQPDAATPKLLAATPDRVEVLSGRVRLTMLRSSASASDPQSTDS